MPQFCEKNGIHEFTTPYILESNRVAERKNKTLMDMVNALLLSSRVPKYLWAKTLLSTCFILDRIHFKDQSTTPYEL